jgi:PAS domain S-box-containing protein
MSIWDLVEPGAPGSPAARSSGVPFGTMTSKSPPDVATAAPIVAATEHHAAGLVPGEMREGVASALLEASPDCVKLLEPDGAIRFLNHSGYTLMEVDPAAPLKGTLWQDLWPKEMRGTIEAALETARTGGPARFDGICPTAKGTQKWWDVVVTSIRGADGEIDCFLCVSRDITAWKAAEESLTLSEQRFRALADNMAQLAWMAYPSGYVFWHNQRWLDFTGVDAIEATGGGWQQVIHPDYADRVVRQLALALERGETWQDTYPIRGADGEYRWFLSRAMPLLNDQGRVVLWCGTDTDVTEQRRTSQRLMKQQRVIELSHEALLVWDVDEGIILFNRGCEELYGYKKSEALGATAADLLKTRYPVSRDVLMERLVEEGAWTGEVRQSSSDGREIWVDSRLELIRTGGSQFVVETNRDVSERRRADEVRNLLVGELNHRVKNTLAIVQSLAAQTGRTSATIDQFISRFNGRVQSLSSAHHMLTEAHWSGASLREIVTSQIAVSAGELNNVDITGDDVFVPPQTALQMTLMLHELTTNALKHGSLSRPQGRVVISWTIEAGDVPRIVLVWTERGGPPVTPPVARGFGTLLLERSGKLPHLKAWLEFNPQGVICRIEADLTDVGHDEKGYFNPRQAAARAASGNSGS